MRFFLNATTRLPLKIVSSVLGEGDKVQSKWKIWQTTERACAFPYANAQTFLPRVGELVKFLQALLLVLLGLWDVLALQSSLIQSLVRILVVGQCPGPPVQKVLGKKQNKTNKQEMERMSWY